MSGVLGQWAAWLTGEVCAWEQREGWVGRGMVGEGLGSGQATRGDEARKLQSREQQVLDEVLR